VDRKSLVSDSRLGTGISKSFFTVQPDTRIYCTVDVGLCCLTVTLGVLFSNSIIDGNILKIKESEYATSILAHKKNTQNRIKVYSGYAKNILPYMENKRVEMNLGLPQSIFEFFLQNRLKFILRGIGKKTSQATVPLEKTEWGGGVKRIATQPFSRTICRRREFRIAFYE
jgi:hypothetical protein